MVLHLLLEHEILLGELNVHFLHSGFQLINIAIPLYYGSLPLNERDIPLPQGLLHLSVLVLQGLHLFQFYLQLIFDVNVKFVQLLVPQSQILQLLS